MCRKEGVTAINPVLMVNTTGWMHRREGVVSWDIRMVETFKICHTFWKPVESWTSLLCHGWLSTVPFSWCMMLLRVFHKLPSCLVPFSVVQWGCGWIQWPRMLCMLPPCLVQWNKFSGLNIYTTAYLSLFLVWFSGVVCDLSGPDYSVCFFLA